MNDFTLNDVTLNSIPSINTGVSSDLACSIVVSGYKWLTEELELTQQEQAVSPYYTCQIINNTLAPNSIMSSPGTPLQGSSAVGPDGKIFSVGFDGTESVGVWIGTSALYGSPFTYLAGGTGIYDSRNHVSIAISDFINGTYKIDVYFYGNMSNASGSGYLTILHYYSLNGGVTWLSAETVNSTITPYNQAGNLWISAGKPYQANNGNIISIVFYIEVAGSNFDIAYQQYPGTGSAYNVAAHWSEKNINTRDWIIHSLDSAYINGYWHIVFSGYQTFYESVNQNTEILNYGIYSTKILALTGVSTTDIWTPASVIINALSSSTQNLNTFTWPQLFFDETSNILYTLFKGVTVNSIADSTVAQPVGTASNFYLSQSSDYINFSYPIPITYTNGTQFTDTNSNSFVRSGKYFYILGNGQLWQFILNNIVADVSSNIISYQLNDTQQSASTISLVIGNQNNQWAGASPTKSGYQAIAGNMKVNLFQGYYTGDTTTAVAPKNIFYIDDIEANVTSNTNDLTIAGRDLYKPLDILQTSYAFNYTGIKKYIDIFDGTTTQNWNFQSGTWLESAANNTLIQSLVSPVESLAIFSFYQMTKANSMITLAGQLPPIASSGSVVRFYFYYIDANDWLRLDVSNNGSGTNYSWEINQNVADSPTSLQSGTFNGGGTQFFPFMFVRESYGKCQIYVGSPTSDGQAIGAFASMTALGTEVDFTLAFAGLGLSPGSFALGGNNFDLTFQNFRYLEYDLSQNIQELVESIATKAGIYSYKMPTVFQDEFYDDSNYQGEYAIVNRNLSIPANTTVLKDDIQFTNADIKFTSQLSALNPSSEFSFDFIFQNTGLVNTWNNYFVRFQNDGTGYITVQLWATYLEAQYMLTSTGGSSSANNLNIDFTQSHTCRVVFFNSYMFVLVDDQVVLGWFDNNITNVQTSGYIGFRTSANSTLLIKNVIGTTLYSQVETFAINPGDDLETSIENVIGIVSAYFFSDNWGRLKVVSLNSSDPSTYTYENQLILQATDNSDKEYVNQVVVVGANGITATATDAVSIGSNQSFRTTVVNNNQITNYNDALTLAQQTLTATNKYTTQSSPQITNNVGSEIYDVITVVNTGNNTANTTATVRNYSQQVDAGGNNLSYWITLGTGTL